jgi:hypothetical protein
MGRFPRSVEMITHLPVIGSFRNSGKWPSVQLLAYISGPQVLQTSILYISGSKREVRCSN